MGVLGRQVLLCSAVLNKLDVLTHSVVTVFSLFVRLTEVYWTSAEAKSSSSSSGPFLYETVFNLNKKFQYMFY